MAGSVGEIRYARAGARHIAFQVLSDGPLDLVLINESVLPMEALRHHPMVVSYVERFAGWGRLVAFDRTGVGLSDAVPATGFGLDDWVDDVDAVLAAIGGAAVTLISSGPSAGLIALRYAVRHPEGTSALCLYDAIARYRWSPDYPFGVPQEQEDAIDAELDQWWGSTRLVDRRGHLMSTAARYPDVLEWATIWSRRGASPATVRTLNQVLRASDLRGELGGIAVPTLIINHRGVGDGLYLAEHLPNAQFLELQGNEHLVFCDQLDEMFTALADIIGVNPVEPAPTRRLTTVLFTDIVNSTGNLVRVGDHRWAQALDRHELKVRHQIGRFDGHFVSNTGDGSVATFDTPTQAVRCALAIQHDSGSLGFDVRVGVHVGEIELRGDDIAGITVHIAQRVCAHATGGQVLATERVVDLTSGANLTFEHALTTDLKGVPDTWRLHAAAIHLSHQQ